MANFLDCSRPELGAYSCTYKTRDSKLLFGFFQPNELLTPGHRKLLANHLRARIFAVEMALEGGLPTPLPAIARRLHVSVRCLSSHFPKKSGLYAFPPPELATRLTGVAVPGASWEGIAQRIYPVFAELELNDQARGLFAELVRLHRAYPDLEESDGFFAATLRTEIRGHRARRVLPIAELFTGGIRAAFEDWVDEGEPSLRFVADRVSALLVGPVQDAFDAFMSQSPARRDCDSPEVPARCPGSEQGTTFR